MGFPNTPLLSDFEQPDGAPSGWTGTWSVNGGALVQTGADGEYNVTTKDGAFGPNLELVVELEAPPSAGHALTVHVRRPTTEPDPFREGLLLSVQNDGDVASTWWIADRVNFGDTILGDLLFGRSPLAAGDRIGLRVTGGVAEVWRADPGGEWGLIMARETGTPERNGLVSLSGNSSATRIASVSGGDVDEPTPAPAHPTVEEFEPLALDTFDVDGPLSNDWTVWEGGFEVGASAPGVVFGTDSAWCGAYRRDVDAADVEVAAEFSYTSDLQLWARRSWDGGTGYLLYARNTPGDRRLEVYKCVNGAFTLLADLGSSLVHPFVSDVPEALGLRVRGSRLEVWLRDGFEADTSWSRIFDTTDSDVPDAGTVAFEFWGGATFGGLWTFWGGPTALVDFGSGDEQGGEGPSPEWPTKPRATRAANAWTFVLCDEHGGAVRELALARQRKVSFTRNAPAQVAFGLDLDDPGLVDLMAVLRNGTPRLRCYQEGALRFYGFWSPQRDQASGDDQSSSALVFRSPFGRYERAFTGHGAGAYVVANRDAGEIAWDLLAAANARTPLGLARGDVEATANRDRTLESVQVAESIVNLTEVQGGFDFRERFTEDDGADVLALFDVLAQLGLDRTDAAIFEHGEGSLENVLGVTREIRYPVNAVRVLGEDGQFAEAEDLASQAKYGLHEVVVQANDGTVDLATLQARADELIRPDLVRVVEFTPDPDLAPLPWKDYDLGDLVTVRAREGALDVDEQVRVNGFEIDLDDEGNEAAHVLVFEQQATEGV